MLEEARIFSIAAHGEQKYGEEPYIVHLEAVVRLLEPYGEVAKVVGYLHDVVEDTSVGIEAIENEFGRFVADCVAILTDAPGANRREIKAKTYAKMAKINGAEELALIVKSADRLANIEACLENNRKKLEMYRSEHAKFCEAVFRENLCDDIWEKTNEAVGD